ncbi:hypothetical protein Cgig2_022945 [Carnegiea gigantea]|uniref:histone deacetylase n=1 Tax=Carnegiea gigantea TaxID=171969 RepID=A0A9Q1QG32_9CARY|nr:hypothetical protein Cgig2_022945 [Carnegiea gigantea]
MRSKDRISYFYDGDVGSVYFGPNHPMKPHRLCMTHHLVLSYELHKKMEIYRPHKAYPVELAQFHSADYVEFLHRITPDTQHLFPTEMAKYNLGEDCPIFDNLFEFCQIYAGGTIDAARRLNNQLCDIAINWAGGLHHAKKCQASGFCYINDLVLGILELLKYHARVLYIDIDVHHGDGVEEAFYFTDRFQVTGGGGYTKENVARCWAVETGVLLETDLPDEIPDNEYIKYFAPDYSLRIPSGHIENLNSKSYITTIKMQVLENLRCIQHAPSVQMQEVPPDFYIPDFDEDDENPDERMNQHTRDKLVQRDDEYYDGDNDNDHNMDDL